MFNMQISASILAFAALMGVSSAAPTPTPAGGPADACTTIYPSFMGQIQEGRPDTVAYNTLDNKGWFAVTQFLSEDRSLVNGRLQTIVRFDVPAGAESCNLHYQIPTGTDVTQMGNLNPNWSLLNFRVQLSDEDLTWNKVYNGDSETGILNSLKSDIPNLMNPYAWTNIGCSDASYVFALDGDQDLTGITDFEVDTNQEDTVSGAIGPYMTYGCAI
jgi:hypothetical protein